MREVANKLAMHHSMNKPTQTDIMVWNSIPDKLKVEKRLDLEHEDDGWPPKYPNVTAGDLDNTQEREKAEKMEGRFEELVVENGIKLVEHPNQ